MQVALLRATNSDQSRIRGTRVPFIGPGQHQALVESLDVQTKDGKTVVWVRSVLTDSDREACPKLVTSYYDLTSPAKFAESPSGADMFTALIRAVTGAPDDGRLADGRSNPDSELAATLRAVLLDRVGENILRGMAYAVSGAYAKKESTKYALADNGRQYEITGRGPDGALILNRDKERFVYISVSPVEQSDAEVAAARKWLDESFPSRPSHPPTVPLAATTMSMPTTNIAAPTKTTTKTGKKFALPKRGNDDSDSDIPF